MKPIQPPPPTQPACVEFTPGIFERKIQQHGYDVLWEPAAECACRANDDSDDYRIDCASCAGFRFVYPISTPAKVLISGIGANPELLASYGKHVEGMACGTFFADQTPGEWDRVVMTGQYERNHVVGKMREAAGFDSFPKPIAIMPNVEVDTAGTLEDVGVLHLQLVDPTTGFPGASLEENTDFTVTADGEIDWTLGDGLGTAPAAGDRYVVTYFTHPRWFVIGRPNSVRAGVQFTGVATPGRQRLPVRALLGRENVARELLN